MLAGRPGRSEVVLSLCNQCVCVGGGSFARGQDRARSLNPAAEGARHRLSEQVEGGQILLPRLLSSLQIRH